MKTCDLSVFISHPSHFLTDHLPHGDGLAASAFIRHIASRVRTVHIAVPLSDLEGPLPPNVLLHPVNTWTRPSNSRQSLLFRIEYAWRIRRLFEQLRRSSEIDIIHQLNPGVLGLSFLLYKLGPPLVIGPLTPSWEPAETNALSRSLGKIKRLIKLWCIRQSFRRCDAVLAPTRASASLLQEAALPTRLAMPLPFGVDTDQFRPNDSFAPEAPTILFLANLQQRKGIFTLLDAFESLWSAMPQAQLIIGGDGDEREAVRVRVNNMRSHQNITLLGNVPRKDVCATMQRCSLYCLPSFGEPFGISALEAMSCGKPLVVTDGGGLADLVRPEGGIKVPVGDSDALSDALKYLLERRNLQREMGLFNRGLVLEKYRWQVIVDYLLSTYTNLGALAAEKKNGHCSRPSSDNM